MAKTAAPGRIDVPGVGTFEATALPDPFDDRDLEYRPRLRPLPDTLSRRNGTFVMHQQGNSCTGHALAAVINTVLAHAEPELARDRCPPVSPYMLYRLARRYDEFEGETDVGSSLRGALKGWYHHGVLPDSRWPASGPEPDLGEECLVAEARERPLGAFFRVNPYRLDDMQSAIAELNAICVSARIHEGWREPVVLRRGDRTMHVIARPVDAHALGGHAFAIVGYNEVGFVVQNSWGTGWGDGGFATLPYDDWLESAYDAWVARAGVPQTPFAAGRSGTVPATDGRLVTGPAPDLRRLAMHVVNLGNNGRLSASGQFASTPAQIDRMIAHMERWHDFWAARDGGIKRHIVLYAHGGLNSESRGLDVAHQNVNWWLNNRIYPIFFAWQSGVAETLVDHLVDEVKDRIPFAFGFDVMEAVDRGVELVARKRLRWFWEEMKENARAASRPVDDPPDPPGATFLVERLRRYVDGHGAENVAVHLVGHSAGAIFHAGLARRLVAMGIDVDSIAFLAPALRVDTFETDVLPLLDSGHVRSFATFSLSDRQELDDSCGAAGIDVYHKSILFLVSRALEGDHADRDQPLLGMERFLRNTARGTGVSLRQAIERRNGAVIVSPSVAPANRRCEATGHVGFAGDPPTMTSVVMRILGLTVPLPDNEYRPNAALVDAHAAPHVDGPRPMAPATADVGPSGEEPLATTAEPSGGGAAPDQPAPGIEVAYAPESGSPVVDILLSRGWEQVGEAPA